MAEQREEDLELAPAEAGVTFRAEMIATNFLLGYWKHLVGALVLGLVTILIYGQYNQYVQRSQRALAAQISEAERQLKVPLVELPSTLQLGLEEAPTAETLIRAAEKLEAVAKSGKPPGSTEALLKAAELYRLAEAPDRQRAALEAAEARGHGVLAFAAVSALANLDLEEDRGEEAVARLRKLVDGSDGFLAQQAALDLGMALEHLGRPAEAKQVYAEFLEKWSASPRAEVVRRRSARLGGEG